MGTNIHLKAMDIRSIPVPVGRPRCFLPEGVYIITRLLPAINKRRLTFSKRFHRIQSGKGEKRVTGQEGDRMEKKDGRLPADMEVIRATETWQRAGAYYVRIQAMAKKHHIPLRQEFDGHDGPDTKYIVVTDQGFPIATARMYPTDPESMMIGRVVVLPEYRHQGIGTAVVSACEKWAAEMHCRKTVLESRDNKTEFYKELGYEICGEPVNGDTFCCIRMEKIL